MNPVQQKISCVYEIGVTEESSSKRSNQQYKVSATRDMTEKAQKDDIVSAKATEKLDGTCCLIQEFKDQPWLWARHDRKPSKGGERRFAQHKKFVQKAKENGEIQTVKFMWDPKKDFKEVPENWIPASRLEVVDGVVMPDGIGHTPGWVPIELNSRQHCWHLSAVSLTQGFALVLREACDDSEDLVLETQPLSLLCRQTCELIGTNINGNPYGLGNKKCPIHFLVPHGNLSVTCPTPSDFDAMFDWFSGDTLSAQVEGIVWHCSNGELHKLHRHHLNLKWPVSEPQLCQRKVKVQVEVMTSEDEGEGDGSKKGQGQNLFALFHSFNGHTFNSIRDLHKHIVENDPES